MAERITSSSELRGFVADNTGRRKIDTEASLELHIRAATEIDLLTSQISELERRLSAPQQAPAAPVAAAAVATGGREDASESAMMLLRNAQAAADETLAEAAALRAQAAAALAHADAQARAKGENAVAEAMARADQVVADAYARADQIREHAAAEARSLVVANEKMRDRAQFIQRQYLEKASKVRHDAEELADFSRQVEAFAESDMALPPFEPPAELASHGRAAAAPGIDLTVGDDAPGHVAGYVEEPQEVAAFAPATHARSDADDELPPPPPPPPPAVTGDVGAAAPALEAVAPVVERPSSADMFADPPAPKADILDLTEAELAEVLEGRSLDDELFDDELFDDDAIDLTGTDTKSEGFQFFGRD